MNGEKPYETPAVISFLILLFTACMMAWAWPKLSPVLLAVGLCVIAVCAEILGVLHYLESPRVTGAKQMEEVVPFLRMGLAFATAVLGTFWVFTFDALGFEPGAWFYLALACIALLFLGRYSLMLAAWKFHRWRHA
jgi:hypothetical protein